MEDSSLHATSAGNIGKESARQLARQLQSRIASERRTAQSIIAKLESQLRWMPIDEMVGNHDPAGMPHRRAA